jgi:hypothetical protein
MRLSYLINELTQRIARDGDLNINDAELPALLRHLDTLAKAAAAKPFDLIGTIKTLEPSGALVGIIRLRRETRDVPRDVLSAAIITAAKAGHLSLYRHDYPHSLTEQERFCMLQIADGTVYNALAVRAK